MKKISVPEKGLIVVTTLIFLVLVVLLRGICLQSDRYISDLGIYTLSPFQEFAIDKDVKIVADSDDYFLLSTSDGLEIESDLINKMSISEKYYWYFEGDLKSGNWFVVSCHPTLKISGGEFTLDIQKSKDDVLQITFLTFLGAILAVVLVPLGLYKLFSS